ncbi:MAG: hypothetical protein K9G30_07825 [Parvibaculum sp.]|nr:hypothetical protein [Parvibaculum sp.]
MAKSPLPHDPAGEASRNMMRIALVVLSMVGVVAFFVVTGRVEMNEPIELSAEVTQPRTHSEDAPLTLEIALILANNTDELLPLSIGSQCDIFRWFLTDEDQNFVQSQKDGEPCVDLPVKGNLEAKHQMTGSYTLKLDPHRVKPGDYILFVRFWGHELRQPVTID